MWKSIPFIILSGFIGSGAMAANDIIGDHADGELVVVSGAGSFWTNDTLVVGNLGDFNTLSIVNSGQVTSGGSGIGSGDWPNSGGSGSASYNLVQVDGNGSQWTCGGLWIGEGNGVGNQLQVTDAGRAQASLCYVGVYNLEGYNSAQISGNNANFVVSGRLVVGYRASLNSMAISGGASVNSGSAHIGYSNGSIFDGDGNTVTVTDPGSSWTTGDLTLGGERAYGNRLSIQNGGTVTSSYVNISGIYSEYAGNNGVDISGEDSTWVVDTRVSMAATDGAAPCYVTIGDGGELVARQGVDIYYDGFSPETCNLDLNNGGRLTIGSNFDATMPGFHFNAGSTLVVEGQLSGLPVLESGRRLETPSVLGDLTVHGVYAPGNSPADSIIEGALTLAADGTLEMEIGEQAPGDEHDRLTVLDDTVLNGTLVLSLRDDFEPAYGDLFDLFDWQGTVDGTFASIDAPTLSGGLEWDTSQLYTTGQLHVIPEPGTAALMMTFGIGLWSGRRFKKGQSVIPLCWHLNHPSV